VYVRKRVKLGSGAYSLYVRSRIRSRLRERAHDHLVYHDEPNRVLHCTCPGFAYRGVCAATRAIIRGTLRW
jgi:hypothetical protein